MVKFKYKSTIFLRDVPIKLVILLFYCLFLGIYLYVQSSEHRDLFRLFQIEKNGESFLITLMNHQNWFLFFLIALVLPLDAFQNILLRISVFENIRANQKKRNYLFFLFSLFFYASFYTLIHFVLFLGLGKTNLSWIHLGMLFLVLVFGIVVLFLIEAMVAFVVPGFIGLIVSFTVILSCLYWDQITLWLPIKLVMDSLNLSLLLSIFTSIILMLGLFIQYRNYELIEGE